MELKDFVQAIIEEPDVDDHRLILADWLEERDDPRAELIRLQFEMKTIEKSNPKWARLRSRELKLLRAHGGFGTAPKYGRILSWHGGFVDEIETTVAQLVDNSEELVGKTTVRGVQLRASSTRFKKLFDSPHLARIQKLTFKNNHILDTEMSEFLKLGTLENLKELSINNGEMGNEPALSISAMKHFSNLESLKLSGYFVDHNAAKLIAQAKHLKNLKQLSLGTMVESPGLVDIANSANLAGLTKLEVEGTFDENAIGKLHSGKFRECLAELTLGSRVAFHSGGFDNPFPKLKSLEVDGGLSSSILIEIAQHYRGLENLNLAGNAITDSGAEALAQSELLSTLKKLVLTQNIVGLQGVEAIRNSKFWNGKTKLYLRSNNLHRNERIALKEKYGKTFGNLGSDSDHWQ